ncbi:DNA-binding IclR family transcriptional regulator [Alkalihalobacillus xiaoxiensis]|uniref:DNA-binding IclR family transcriptional regulator n=1 Tax=Shouchella xiaoxiensis TaxID=766895 RepID=A0ABS2SYT6_9BACI|nr:IclR family transcriptional regulator [Shouchella xiaoxiensis]MBM7840696.1 DNA-binding IclR family transcriptional regulator [Shouchella xiaoxiensis]
MSTVQSVTRALSILNVLAEHPNGIKITSLAKELDLSKATVHRLLTTLITENFVRQDPDTERYKMGYQIVSLATHFLSNSEMIEIAKPHLKQLSIDINETVHLCIEDQGQVLYIDKIESTQPIALYSRIGTRAPMYCTAVGKVLLSGMPDERYEKIVAETTFEKITSHTLLSPELLEREMKQVKEEQFAIDEQEITEGVRCVALPLFNFKGDIVASFSVAGPINRVTKQFIHETLIEKMKQTSATISRELGFDRKNQQK